MPDAELQRALSEFTGAFAVVFGEDWAYSKELLRFDMDTIVPPDGTFVAPGNDIDRVNWGARAALLKSYERLLMIMEERGMQPLLPVRDNYFVYSWSLESEPR